MRHRFLFLLLTAVFLFAGTANLFAVDYSGNWVANIEKSQFGSYPRKSYVMTVEKAGPNAYQQTVDQVYADGRKRHEQFTRIYDGQEHAFYADGKEHPGSPKDLTQICTQVDPLTRHIVVKSNGKVTLTIDSKMTPDGKTMTNRMTYFAQDGQSDVEVHVFERR